ncbi:hypothetical protein GDO86_016585 [Hymenochirus boettgeri]|uniref:Uncharacterized protein n=1 Tax=Hymenochirus boettgeri TaxID=247094 RepID=A0A8T2K2G5_9PIPI|nr:hypothetical protein GDO86_016585 [Hymenochirus boettgeri]
MEMLFSIVAATNLWCDMVPSKADIVKAFIELYRYVATFITVYIQVETYIIHSSFTNRNIKEGEDNQTSSFCHFYCGKLGK